MTTVWGLVDDRTGHTGQVFGVITKLGLPYVVKRLEYNLLGSVTPLLLGATFATLDRKASAPIAPPWPALVIAAGRRILPVLRAIKRHSPTTRTVYLMEPEVTAGIDLIAVPEHDGLPPGPNMFTTVAPLHAVTAEALAAARAAWAPQLAHLPRPYIGLCIGGNTRQARFTAAQWRELITRAVLLVGDGSLLITTSRRTPPEALELITPLLQIPHLLHRWNRDKDNPYLGILACADGVIVTGDSLSMCAEACVAGKPVFIYAAENIAPPKHRRLHTALYQRGLARPLDTMANLGWKPAVPLDDAGRVAAEIRTRFPEIFASAAAAA